MITLLKNISINLHATGPAAVVIVWIIAMTILGLYGTGPLAGITAGLLFSAGLMIISAFASHS